MNSALASKMGQIKKKVLSHYHYELSNVIQRLFLFDHHLVARADIFKFFFVPFFGKSKTPKFHSETICSLNLS